MNAFRKSYWSWKTVGEGAAHIQEYVSARRTNIDELSKEIDRMIEEDGVAAARRKLFWKVNVLTVIYERRLDSHFQRRSNPTRSR